MNLKKSIGFIASIIFIMCMFSATATASTGFELGEFTVISENNQQNGWCTNGVDGIETDFYIRALQRVTSFFFDFDSEVDNIVFVCFGDGNGWTWTETPVYVDAKRGHIDVADIDGWADIIAGNDVKILLCNYNPSWENITVNGFTSMPSGPFENEEAWTPKDFKIGEGKTIITAVDFDPGNFEEHGAEYDRYIIRPEMQAQKGPQTEVGWSGFGDNICLIDAGEWVQYTVEATKAGTYNFSAWLASDFNSSGNIEVYVDDVFAGVSADTENPYYDLYSIGSIDLTVGTHIVKTVFPKGGVLFSALEIDLSDTNVTNVTNVIEPAPKTGDTKTIIFAGIIIFAAITVIAVFKIKNAVKLF